MHRHTPALLLLLAACGGEAPTPAVAVHDAALVLVSEESTLSYGGLPAVPSNFGGSAAVSADGTRAAVAGPGSTGSHGQVLVFRRSGASWTRETTIDASTDGALTVGALFGTAVALSSDGSRLAVGAPASGCCGQVHVYARSGAAWTRETFVAGTTAGGRFGDSVAISDDGTRVLVGATNADAATVLVRSGTTWTTERVLVPAARVPGDGAGSAVALSGDGTRALVGAPFDDGPGGVPANVGIAYVFVRSGTTWTEEASLAAPGGAGFELRGAALAVSGDGTRAMVGEPGSPGGGRAYVWSRTGAAWSLEATLTTPGAAASEGFGRAVSLSSAGDRAIVGAPSHTPAGIGRAGSVTVFDRSGTAWAEVLQIAAGGAEAQDELGTSVSITADGTRVVAGAARDNPPLVAFSFELRSTLGSPCTSARGCESGICADGVCCDVPCGSSGTDCQACSVTAGATANGTCSVLLSGSTCRASLGGCDPAEVCTGLSPTCPVDVRTPAGGVCRASVGGCDAAEICDGTSLACPADTGLAPAGSVCRAAAGTCDVEEVCDGTSAACPGDVRRSAGAVCRAASGGCDVAEVCDGAGTVCPGDALAASGTVCRGSLDVCDVEERCTGVSAACPVDVVLPGGTPCRAATSACDAVDLCDGFSAACVDTYAPATTICDRDVSGPCDAPDHCAGTSGDCVPTFLAGVECRPAAGGCDPPEVCSGSAADCPPDVLAGAGLVCRASTGACDPEESCDGASPACPFDESTCGPRPDAGAADASMDAGGGPAPTAGCACGVGRGHGGEPTALFFVVLVLAHARRRRAA